MDCEIPQGSSLKQVDTSYILPLPDGWIPDLMTTIHIGIVDYEEEAQTKYHISQTNKIKIVSKNFL